MGPLAQPISAEDDPGPRMALGGTADVYAWGDRQILKLYRPGASDEQIQREAAQTAAALAAGAPAPAVAGVIQFRGRLGIVFERIEGPTLVSALAERPNEVLDCARQFAGLHARLHSLTGTGLPGQRDRMRTDIQSARLSPELRASVLAALDGLPNGDAVCHGDFHPLNVIVSSTGPMVIDWYNATCGNPLADVARTVLLLEFTDLPRHSESAVRVAVDAVRVPFLAAYRAGYAALRPFDPAELRAWTVAVAAARLAKPLSAGEQAFLVALVRAGLGR